MSRRLVAPLVTAVALAGLLGGCGTSTVSASDVEDQITTQLKGSDGSTPDSADCPEDLKAEVGEKITCDATAGDDSFKVDVEVTSVEDGKANFDITVVS